MAKLRPWINLVEVDKFAVSNPQLSDLGSKPQFSSAPSFVEKLLLSTFFAFSGKPQKIMEGLPVVWANWVKRAGCRFSPKQVTPAPLSLAILELESEMRGHSLIPFLIDWKWWLWSVMSRMPPSPDPWLHQNFIQNGVFKFAANLKMAICRLWSLSFTRQLACWKVKYFCSKYPPNQGVTGNYVVA